MFNGMNGLEILKNWPRFEDGEPVRVGDEFTGKDGKTYTVKQVRFMGFYFSLYDFGGEKPQFKADYGERVKRPTPKVLDADGVEIEVGDDLYSVEGMLKFHVSAIDKKSGRIATEAMFALDKWADPKMYTHRAPVLAADGKPKGTMTATFEPTLDVWRMLDGKPTEYVVVNPVTVEAKFKGGEVRRYPQEIRERVVRCRDCAYSTSMGYQCEWFHGDYLTYAQVVPEGFCAWGEPREED